MSSSSSSLESLKHSIILVEVMNVVSGEWVVPSSMMSNSFVGLVSTSDWSIFRISSNDFSVLLILGQFKIVLRGILPLFSSISNLK